MWSTSPKSRSGFHSSSPEAVEQAASSLHDAATYTETGRQIVSDVIFQPPQVENADGEKSNKPSASRSTRRTFQQFHWTPLANSLRLHPIIPTKRYFIHPTMQTRHCYRTATPDGVQLWIMNVLPYCVCLCVRVAERRRFHQSSWNWLNPAWAAKACNTPPVSIRCSALQNTLCSTHLFKSHIISVFRCFLFFHTHVVVKILVNELSIICKQ